MKELNYRGMSVSEGVAHVESHYALADLEKVKSFSDLHDMRDANMTLPFPDDCGQGDWLVFANTVIEAFDLKLLQDASGGIK